MKLVIVAPELLDALRGELEVLALDRIGHLVADLKRLAELLEHRHGLILDEPDRVQVAVGDGNVPGFLRVGLRQVAEQRGGPDIRRVGDRGDVYVSVASALAW